MLAPAFPNELASEPVPLEGGLSNASYRLQLGRFGDVVLRVYLGDPMTASAECAALALASRVVPVPDVVYAGLLGSGERCIVYRYIAGETFRDVKRRGDRTAIAACAFVAGQTLARLGTLEFAGGTPFRGDGVAIPRVLAGNEAWRRFVRGCAESSVLVRRIGGSQADVLLAFADTWAPRLGELAAPPVLVHGDFSRSNILVDGAPEWRVAAVIDWEFACAGSQLYDLGHFLRYEDPRTPLLEPHFSAGFLAAGGVLPSDWRRKAQVVDVAAVAGALTKPHLPKAAALELCGLLRATLALQ